MTAFWFSTKSRAFLSKVLMVAMLLSALAAGSIAAAANYDDAKRQFDALKPNERSAFVMFLIATGDFNGLYQQSCSERLHAAVEQFQKRNGGLPTGPLTSREREKLIEEAGTLLTPLGFKRHEIAEVGAALEVPRAVFESEASTSSGYSFETSDKNLSLGFDHFDKCGHPIFRMGTVSCPINRS